MKKRGLLIGAALLLLLSGCSKQADRFDELIDDTLKIEKGGIVLRNTDWFQSEKKVMKAYHVDESAYESNEESGTARISFSPDLKDLENTGITVEQAMSFAAERLYRVEFFISMNEPEEYLDCLASISEQLQDFIPDGESKDALDFNALTSASSPFSWTAADESSISVYPFEMAGEPAYMIIIALNSPIG